MGGAWFKPKTHGYGASPASWKGWVAITGNIVVTFAIQWPWFLSPFLAEEEPTIGPHRHPHAVRGGRSRVHLAVRSQDTGRVGLALGQ